MTRFPYTRITGSRGGFVRNASLWEGSDHLLSVKGTRFREEYRRFYYSDIQAFFIVNDLRLGSIGWWLVLILLFISSVILVVIFHHPAAFAILAAMVAAIVWRLLICTRRGCRCYIQTAVSLELLPSLRRRKHAQAFAARLNERVRAVQVAPPLPDPMGGETLNL